MGRGSILAEGNTIYFNGQAVNKIDGKTLVAKLTPAPISRLPASASGAQ
jgi:hypothetical protein